MLCCELWPKYSGVVFTVLDSVGLLGLFVKVIKPNLLSGLFWDTNMF